MCGPQVRFCERPGGAIPQAYSTSSARHSGRRGRCPGGSCCRQRKTDPGPGRAGEAPAATIHGRVQASHSSRGRPLDGARPARRPVAPRGPVLVALDHLAAATRHGSLGRVEAQAPRTEAQGQRSLDCREPAAGEKASPGRDDHRGPKKLSEVLGIPLPPSDSSGSTP